MEFLSCICTPIVEVTIAPVGRQLGYLFYYQRNKDNLEKKINDLKDKKDRIDILVKEAQNRDEEAGKEVNKWQDEVEKSRKEAEDFLNDERHRKASCSCSGSLWLRYQLSRKSNKMEKTIASIIENANSLENNFHRRPVKCLFENRDFVAFDTRMATFKEIMEALEDPNCSRIGVFGIGGVGKTTLVNEVAQKAKEKGLFNDVVSVTVSQVVDLKHIQKNIMEMLNLKVDEESMEARASRLRHRLEGQGKVLLILDDIWGKLDLKAIGIYLREDGKGSKLLLVSRNQDILRNDMDVEKDIEVRVLSEEEAMNLFNKYVGRTSDDRKFKDLATKIVGRCGRLPIAIVTIACALKNREIHVWRDALMKLKRSPKEGYGKAYWSIRTSYDFLESDQERMILLLCSLHKEDAVINVENLTSIYSAYCDMFRHGSSLQEARDSVRTCVDNLKGRSLLLNGGYDGAVKLHDVIRQIMMSIASEENNMHCLENLTSLSNLNQAKLKDSAAISLLGPEFDQLPNDLACPKLKLLMHQSRNHYYGSQHILVPEGFLEGAKELRALCLVSVIVKTSSLSPSSLSNLTTLSLQRSILEDIALIGELEKLVILDLSDSKFRELPEQIGKLTCLRQLNLNWCTNLKVVRPNVISSLKQMEELYMDEVYIKWGMEAEVGGGQNADLAELVELRHLRALHLFILDASALPKHKLFDNENLEWYHIVVGRPLFPRLNTRSRLLHLRLNEQSPFYECGFQRLIKEVEELCLKTVPGVENIVNPLDANCFLQLKKLGIYSTKFHASSSVTPTGPLFNGKVAFPSLEKLELEDVDFSELWPNGLPSTSFMKNLTRLSVGRCKNLKYLFPFAMVGSFMQLEHLRIYNCAMMEEIIKESPGRSGKILFPKLRNLTLESLRSLKRFCGGDWSMECESLLKIEITYCPQLQTFNEKVPYFNILPKMIFRDLQKLKIQGCNTMTYLLSFATAESLKQLKKLLVWACDVMEHVIRKAIGEDGRLKKISFPKLECLDLNDLPMLESFCEEVDFIECPSLLELKLHKCKKLRTFIHNLASTTPTLTEDEQQVEVKELVTQQPLFNEKVPYFNIISKMIFRDLQKLKIQGCNTMTYLLSFAAAESLKQLKKLLVWACDVMEHVISKAIGENGRLKKISFPKLECLDLNDLPMLESFCEGADFIECPSLLELKLHKCKKLRTFIHNLASTTPTLTEDEQQVEVKELVTQQPLFNKKVMFPCLKELEVRNCESLKYLLSYEMARSLLQLESLKVYSCKIIEELEVIKEADEEGTLIHISFPKLKYLHLRDLPMLQRFSADFAKWSCPSLLKLNIKNIFDDGEVSYFGILSNMIFNDLLQLEISGPTWWRVGERQVEFSKLEDGWICCCGEDVNEIWPRQSSTPLFPKFKVLHLRELTNLMHLFDNQENIQSMPQAVQPLEALFVYNCPGLKTLAASSYFSFRNLTDVSISKCHGMTSILDSSTAESLEQLTRMSITECDQLKHVIRTNHKLQDESAEGDEIVFRRLKILAFRRLPSLEGFHGGNNNTLEFPSLERLIVSECPEMWTFSHGSVNTPKLNRSIITEVLYWPRLFNVQLWIEDLERVKPVEEVILEGDLNRSIRKLWEENNDPHIALRWLFAETTDVRIPRKYRRWRKQKHLLPNKIDAHINKETKGSEESDEGRSANSPVTRRRVRSRWL